MTSISYSEMEVELLSQDDPQIVQEAWRVSRPQERINPSGITTGQIMAIDAPVSELTGVVLRMKVPILIRELIFTMRDHIAWARTSRVDDLFEWDILHPRFIEDDIG